MMSARPFFSKILTAVVWILVVSILPRYTHAVIPIISSGPAKALFTNKDIGEAMADNNPGTVMVDSTRFDWFFMCGNSSFHMLRGPAQKPNDSVVKAGSRISDWMNQNGVKGWPWILGAYKDDGTGNIYGLCHLELLDSTGVYPTYYRMGIAKSTNGGLNWTMQGTIIIQYNEQKGDASNNIFGAGWALKDGYMYVWYMDCSTARLSAVARCAMSDILAGHTDKWYKYYNGAFTEPGLGGNFTPLSSQSVANQNNISYNTYLKKFVRSGGGLLFSDDGITWGDGLSVQDGTVIYAAITSPGYKENTSGRIFDMSWYDGYGFLNTRYVRRFYIGPCFKITLVDSVTRQTISNPAVLKLKRAGAVIEEKSEDAGLMVFLLPDDSDNNPSYTLDVSVAGYLPQTGVDLTWNPNQNNITISCARRPLVGLEVQPDTVSIMANTQKQLVLLGIYSDSTKMALDIAPVWTSRSPGLVGVSGTGLLSGVAQGACHIVASIPTLSLSDSVFVSSQVALFHYSRDFSSTQGKNNAYYQYWDGASYQNMTWDGAQNIWSGNNQWLRLWNGKFHPASSGDAVLSWVSQQSCDVRIKGNVKKADLGGGNGIIASIKKNGMLVWGPVSLVYNDSIGVKHDIAASVAAGDTIHFFVNQNNNNNYDATSWDPAILLESSYTHLQDENLAATLSALSVTPNPFNPIGNIVNISGLTSGATLKVLDIRGKVVADLTKALNSGSGSKGPRHVRWDAANHASGLYVVVLKNGKMELKRKAMLIR